MHVTPERFVTVWQSADDVDEVCKRLGMTKAAAVGRAARYRKRGIALKMMARGGAMPVATMLDVDALKKLATRVA